MIRIDLENVIRDSKLYKLAKKNCPFEQANQLVGELCNEIGMLYFEQDGVEFDEDFDEDYNEREIDNNREQEWYNE